ncbi:MAG: AlpA family transcriptional regulator [Deferribacteraceae bacterium]|jgi:predicted DNA-binding transcriptional regulator AlpA|nr:AlpA family transcriptional regulator [Deferribacteraceae bacterium]
MENIRFIRNKKVLAVTGFSRSQIFLLMKDRNQTLREVKK